MSYIGSPGSGMYNQDDYDFDEDRYDDEEHENDEPDETDEGNLNFPLVYILRKQLNKLNFP